MRNLKCRIIWRGGGGGGGGGGITQRAIQIRILNKIKTNKSLYLSVDVFSTAVLIGDTVNMRKQIS